MLNESLTDRAGRNLARIREQRPLIHNITNFVVMNFTANALLAMGASPVMAHAAEEVEEMVSLARALVLNIGTLSREWIDSMLKAGKRAAELNIPVVLDPVGSGATHLRTQTARDIIDQARVWLVRGNASEIISLGQKGSRTKGVDSTHSVQEAAETAQGLARELETAVAITGPTDLVTDGRRTVRVDNGHPLMGRITGTGCAASALCAAFLAVDNDRIGAAASALSFLGLAGERAGGTALAPGCFQYTLLDALYLLTPEELAAESRVTEMYAGKKE
ncbi:MAG: hydroxyethylthiazole kinase [Desulfovermiculus sp.]|nr:hydroxyethylthiazole kinase [Desulfovermiculus sp.]